MIGIYLTEQMLRCDDTDTGRRSNADASRASPGRDSCVLDVADRRGRRSTVRDVLGQIRTSSNTATKQHAVNIICVPCARNLD